MEELNELQKECSPQTLTPHTAASQPSQEKNHNDLTIFFNQDQFNIIKQWRKIHRFLFKHGIYALMLLLGTVSVYILTLFTQDTKIATEENFSEKEHLAAQQENINKQVPELSGLTIDILYGKLTLEKSILSSVSNLATYQEIVLPRVAEISTTKPLFDWEKFNNNQTSPTDISKLIQQLIIAPANKNSALPKETILTLSQGIISDFNLQCLGEQKLSNIVCRTFLSNFLSYGMLYDIGNYPQDLQYIQTALKKRDKEYLQFCTLIYEHTKYYRQNTDTLTTIMQQCPTDQWQQYKTLNEFITVDQDIANNIISSNTSTNPNINAYKLLSLQQILYKNLQAGNPNKNFLISYLNYSQQLINKPNALAPLYKDMLYRINTNILLPKLETSTSKTITKTEINQIINQITLLNRGNPTLQDKGLESLLTTPELIQYREIGTVNTTIRDINELITPLLELTDNLRIQRTTIAEDQQTVDFQLEIFSPQILAVFGESIKAKITLFRKGEMLYMQNLTLINLVDLTTYLQNAIQGTNTTLPQLIGMINENISFYYQPPQPLQPQKSLCESIKEDISDASILSCTSTTIDLFKNGINYTFQINNEVLVDITISDKALEQQIKSRLQTLLITKSNTLAYITEILHISDTASNTGEPIEQYTEQRVLINERMKRYLNVIPEIKNVDENTFIVTFKVGEITLQGKYDIATHSISTISFVIKENSMLLIRDFTLPLNEENRNNLAELLNNPRLYLRLFNQAAFDKYERMLNEKK